MNAPARYTKRPVTIEAMQWTSQETTLADLKKFTNNLIEVGETDEEFQVYDRLHDTWVNFSYTDWIIKGVKGEFYPCADDVFHATYMREQDEPEQVDCGDDCADCEQPKKKGGVTVHFDPPSTYGPPVALADAVRRGMFDPYRQRS